MKCTFCHSNNTIIHIHEYSLQGIKKINLCFECALMKGLNIKADEIDKLFKNLIKNIFKLSESNKNTGLNKKNTSFSLICPSCKSTINNINEEMTVGCPICYVVFEKFIDLLIYKTNNSLNYIGKLPLELRNILKNRVKLINLKRELKKNVSSENFSNAALVRDEIITLKKAIKKSMRKREGR
jgi:protein arginine kinase activator